MDSAENHNQNQGVVDCPAEPPVVKAPAVGKSKMATPEQRNPDSFVKQNRTSMLTTHTVYWAPILNVPWRPILFSVRLRCCIR